MKKYQYLRKVYDNESTLDFDLAKLGAAGWLMCGIVRWNPSPARISYMVWYSREMIISESKKKFSNKISNVETIIDNKSFSSQSSALRTIGPMIPRVEGDPLAPPINWPEFTPDENPFDDSEVDFSKDI